MPDPTGVSAAALDSLVPSATLASEPRRDRAGNEAVAANSKVSNSLIYRIDCSQSVPASAGGKDDANESVELLLAKPVVAAATTIDATFDHGPFDSKSDA